MQSYPILCYVMDCSMPGLHVPHHPLEFSQVPVYNIVNAIQPSHPLSPSSPSALIFPSIRVFSNKSTVHIRWPKYWSFSISPSNECLVLNSFKIDWFDLLAPRDSQESSPAPQLETINSSAVCLLYGPALTNLRDYWEDLSLDYAFNTLCILTHCLGLT